MRSVSVYIFQKTAETSAKRKENGSRAAKRGKDFRDMKKGANYVSLRECPKPFEELKSLAHKGSGSSLVKLQRPREAPQSVNQQAKDVTTSKQTKREREKMLARLRQCTQRLAEMGHEVGGKNKPKVESKEEPEQQTGAAVSVGQHGGKRVTVTTTKQTKERGSARKCSPGCASERSDRSRQRPKACEE